MKTIFTFLIILISFLGSFSQSSNNSGKKLADNSFSAINAQTSFSIIKAYPNPVKDQVTIEVHANQPGNVEISLYNILGTEVKKWNPWYLDGDNQITKLDLSSFHPGIYFLKLKKSDQIVTQVLKKN